MRHLLKVIVLTVALSSPVVLQADDAIPIPECGSSANPCDSTPSIPYGASVVIELTGLAIALYSFLTS